MSIKAESEAILPQRVIAEAVALRAEHKSGSVQPNEYYTAQMSELQDVVDNARELEREKRQLEMELSNRNHTLALAHRRIVELEAKLASGVVPLVAETDGIPWDEPTVASKELNEQQQLSLAMPVRACASRIADGTATPAYALDNITKSESEANQPEQQLLTIADGTATPASPPDKITESYPESRCTDDSKEPRKPADDPEPEPTSENLEPELPPRSQVEKPVCPKGLELGDLVQINATSDRTWNGLVGYIQKLVTATGKAVVLLQGDYRSKNFFLDELKLVHQGVQPPEPVEETHPDAIAQSPSAAEPEESGSTITVSNNAVALEQVQAASLPEASGDASAALQPLVADWEVLKQLRDAEGSLRKTDTLIEDLNSQLAQSGSNVVERELRPVLKKQLDLRSTTVNQIVALIDTSRIQAYYEEQQNKGRVVLDRKYASDILLQAQSWSDVVMVVGGNTKQLLAAVKPWSFDEKQHLVRLLSTYLETEPLALENIDWIPKKLLEKSLSTLSFKIRKIGGASNLADEPKIEYIPCDFVSLEYPGTRSEQWIFRGSDNKLYPVFGRDEIEVERF